MGNYFASNSCHTSPHHLLTVYRGREIGRLSRKFLLILSARGQASSHFIDPMLSVPPFRLGFPDGKNLSNYVLPWRRTDHRGRHCCGYQADGEVFNRTRKHSSSQNHGRNEAYLRNSPSVASAETTTMSNHLDGDGLEATVRVERGDHAAEMSRICSALIESASLQDHFAREALARPHAVSHPYVAVHRRRQVLQGVQRSAQCRGRRVRSLEADCGNEAGAEMEFCAGEYCSEGGRRGGAEV